MLANEIHLPAGRAVVLGLNSGDVIHSFWVPALAGKVDMIPGRVQQLRLAGRGPGRHRGQCAEFCGEQHAQMALEVVVEPPPAFDAWLRRRPRRPRAPRGAAAARGLALFRAKRCVACHTIRGLAEGGAAGPDLTHVARAACIGAGTLPPTTAGFARWLADVQQLKPGARMPAYDTARSGGARPRWRAFLGAAANERRDRRRCRARLPRPAGELEALERAWEPPKGWRLLSAVNNTHIGVFYIATALLFFVLAGVLALLMRAQLALPGARCSAPGPTTRSSPCTAR